LIGFVFIGIKVKNSIHEKLWTTMNGISACSQKKKINRTCSSLKDSRKALPCTCLSSGKGFDFSMFLTVIHRNMRFLLLPLFFYKTSNEQPKAQVRRIGFSGRRLPVSQYGAMWISRSGGVGVSFSRKVA
jgi:hypothetical protein